MEATEATEATTTSGTPRHHDIQEISRRYHPIYIHIYIYIIVQLWPPYLGPLSLGGVLSLLPAARVSAAADFWHQTATGCIPWVSVWTWQAWWSEGLWCGQPNTPPDLRRSSWDHLSMLWRWEFPSSSTYTYHGNLIKSDIHTMLYTYNSICGICHLTYIVSHSYLHNDLHSF